LVKKVPTENAKAVAKKSGKPLLEKKTAVPVLKTERPTKKTVSHLMAKEKPQLVGASKQVKKSVRNETIKSWYDYPELYEMGFLKDTPKESKFLGQVFSKYVNFPVQKVLELGCGSGRLICDMAARGYAMTGLDLNPTALEYCRKKLHQKETRAELVVGDMTDFSFDEPFDAAVNAINTFRHLATEEDALAHLNCVAKHLKPGGVFVLSLHLLPPDGDLWGTERWSAKQGDLSVYYALTVVETSMKTRLEKLRISMLVKNKKESFRLSDHITLRIYTAKHLKSLLSKVKLFKLLAVHDFWCDVESEQKLDKHAVDTVLVLQRI
jgi:SAM-dependent methyltransferase